tara:strand:+ start:865 stop:1932 length:1068 start_codon:yes stop_codon:yes gene_type:complete
MLKDKILAQASMVRSRALSCALDEAETQDSRRSTSSESNAIVVGMHTAAREARERLDSGEDPPSVLAWLISAWVGVITLNATSAFRKGAALRSTQVPPRDALLLKEYPRLRKSIVDQSRYLSRFASDFVDGVPEKKGRMSFVNRSMLYANSAKGYFNLGAMLAGKNRDLVFWNLGECEHCTDCVALSVSGPYFSDELPTVPGMGHTKCGHNCCCHLSIRPGAERLLSPSRLAVGPLVAAGGLRAPSRQEALSISDTRLREAYVARTAQDVDGDRSAIIRRRDDLRSEIDERISGLRINFPELLPLGGPIALLFASSDSFEEEFDEKSIDGASLMRLKSDQLDAAVEGLLESLDDL